MNSVLHDYESVKLAIDKSSSKRQVLESLGLRAAGGNYRSLDKACQKHGLKLPVYDGYTAHLKSKIAIPLEEILVANSTYVNRGNIKSRCFKIGLLKNECYDCGLPPIWNGKEITLQLDHINGISNDHRIENLQILCPNCHSQTNTYAGRSRNGGNSKKSCTDCGCSIDARATRCRNCNGVNRQKPTH